ncbi:MAG: hypothetical protein IPM47_17495 [Sphingobacteriales bacterium]|nr:MAG: hypothetical protein IPM47_17495 [Sphingobacteriales bacterium]
MNSILVFPCLFLLYTPFIPNELKNSKSFWLLIAATFILTILYHNIKLTLRNNPDFFKFFRSNSKGTPTISYKNEGRSGYVQYQSVHSRFALYYEFGGGNCVVCIDLPSPQNWEKHTGIPIAKREETIQFIGNKVVADQTTGGKGYFKIEGNSLNIYV